MMVVATAAVGMEEITIKLCNVLTFFHAESLAGGTVMKFHFELFSKMERNFHQNFFSLVN